MDRLSGIKKLQEDHRQEMRIRIDTAILSMRAEKTTITITTLAEELGVSRRALYAEYVQSFLKNYREFNPDVSEELTAERVTELENALAACKGMLKRKDNTIKELRLENSILKQSLHESEERYKYVLGHYQEDVGNKIIHF